jgi:hypothetical protein
LRVPWTHRAAFAIFVCVLMLAGAARAEAVPSVTFKCTPAPQNCSGWYTQDVSIEWTVIPSDATTTGCQNQTFTTDTPGTNSFCQADDGEASITVQLKIKVDKTPPVVTGSQPSRAGDANGWYNHAVSIAFSGSDQTSGIASCPTTTYGGPDKTAVSVQGRCYDKAGNESAPLPYGLKYDATAPVITGASPERPPDYAGWFTDPVRFGISASDATSGLADCPPVEYAGPDGTGATVTASCRDAAGNVSARTFGLKYDATPPPLSGLAASAGDRTVGLSWRTTRDAQAVEVVRTPGVGTPAASVVFRGPGTSFIDGRVENGVRYAYDVRVRDAAGNASDATVSALPKAPPSPVTAGPRRRLLAPSPGAVFTYGRRPYLRWTPVRRAGYYNVQLRRNGRKILSAWPSKARYLLRLRWSYRGKRYRLAPGRYSWVVWPGFDPRSRADYGRRLGPRKFVVRRVM